VRIVLDTERCTGHGRCYTVGAEFYESDDDGYCLAPPDVVPAGLEEAARRGARNCPEQALTIVDE
jgi:ferredoxin